MTNTIVNISSLFILLPIFVIQTNLFETFGIVTIYCVSTLYHTNREWNKNTIEYLSNFTISLYNVDRFLIQFGFTYCLAKNLLLNFLLQIPLYYITLENSQNSIMLFILCIGNIITTLIMMPVNCLIICSGMLIASFGHRGTSFDGNHHKINDWSEIRKCIWHGGTGIAMIGLLKC
jgi:hypothetical protein